MSEGQTTEQSAAQPQATAAPKQNDMIEARVVASEMYNRLKLAKYSALGLIMVSIVSPLAYITNTYIGLTIMVVSISAGVFVMHKCDSEIKYLEEKYKLTLEKKFTLKPRG